MSRFNKKSDRKPGSWFRIDEDTVVETECGHSFVTCHTDKCFLKEENMEENGVVVGIKDLRVNDIVTAVKLDGSRTVDHAKIKFVGTKGFDHDKGMSVSNADRDWVVVRFPRLPDNWPPEAGDVWEADGSEWHYTRNNAGYMIPVFGNDNRMSKSAAELLKLDNNATLLYRSSHRGNK